MRSVRANCSGGLSFTKGGGVSHLSVQAQRLVSSPDGDVDGWNWVVKEWVENKGS